LEKMKLTRPARIGLIGLVVCLAWISGCKNESSPDRQDGKKIRASSVPVTVAEVIQKDIPVQLENFGTVEPFRSVPIKSQIDGQIIKVHFQKGQEIKSGDLLFTIDPRPREAALKQAEATLAKDVAQAKFAQSEAKRYSNLADKGSVAQQKYEQALSTEQSFLASIRVDNALIDNAKLQLEYCSIHSPIDGVAGDILMNQGSMVKANDLPLVVVNQVKPIYVSFSVHQQHLGEIRKLMAVSKLEVQVSLPSEPGHSIPGTLTFINNTVNIATGTIQLQAAFPNQDNHLWPGQYVWVTLTLSKQKDAIIVPSQALQTGQKGAYVFVVKPDLSVELRSVEVDRTLAEGTLIAKGLRAKEQVVTDGQFRLIPGAKIEIKKGLTGGEGRK